MDVVACLAGVACKVYDDLNDNGLLPNPFHQRILEGFQHSALALISASDFTFAVIFYCMNVLNALSNVGEWAKPHETSLLILYPLLLIMSFGTAAYPSAFDAVCMGVSTLVMAIEPIIITEEASLRKWAIRFWTAFAYTVAFVVLRAHVARPVRTLLLYTMGYFTVSSLFQMAMVTGLLSPAASLHALTPAPV